MPAPTPQFIPEAFALNAAPADRNTIPAAPVTTQRASFSLGFPPLTMTPVVAGGKPMLGPDMNGILYMMSSHTVYQQTGQPYRWAANVAAAIAGYAVGTVLGSTDGATLWYNVVAANSTNPDDDATAAGWVALYCYGITPIATTGLVRTLTPTEAARNVLVVTGALVANSQIIVPNQVRRWLIINSTTGAFSLTAKTAAGAGVTVPQGGFNSPVEVWSDATNVYNVVAPVNLPIDQAATPLTIVQRTNAGYIYATYLNVSNALENFDMTEIFFGRGDGFLRKISPANFQAQLMLANFSGQVTNAQVPQSAVTQHSAAILASAALTGVPTTPTAAVGTNTGQVASTAFVRANQVKIASGRIVGHVLQPGSVGVTSIAYTPVGQYVVNVTAAGFSAIPAACATIDVIGVNSDTVVANAVSPTVVNIRTILGNGTVDRNFNFIITGP